MPSRLMVKVKACAGEAPTTLVALKLRAYAPAVPAAGVPRRVPVPLPLSTKVTPPGKVTPPRVRLGVGAPVVVTVKAPTLPTVNVVAFTLVIVGA